MADSIIIENNGAIRTITLNRHKAFNSFDREMGAAFQTALDEAGKDDSVRCIVIKGEGRGHDYFLSFDTTFDTSHLSNGLLYSYVP